MLRRQWIFASLFSVPVIRGLTDTEPTSRDVSVCVRGVESFSNHILIRLKTHTPTAETAVTHMQWRGKHDEDDKDEEGRRGICDNIVIVACRANFFEKASTSKWNQHIVESFWCTSQLGGGAKRVIACVYIDYYCKIQFNSLLLVRLWLTDGINAGGMRTHEQATMRKRSGLFIIIIWDDAFRKLDKFLINFYAWILAFPGLHRHALRLLMHQSIIHAPPHSHGATSAHTWQTRAVTSTVLDSFACECGLWAEGWVLSILSSLIQKWELPKSN